MDTTPPIVSSLGRFLRDTLSGAQETPRVAQAAILIPVGKRTSFAKARKDLNELFDRAEQVFTKYVGLQYADDTPKAIARPVQRTATRSITSDHEGNEIGGLLGGAGGILLMELPKIKDAITGLISDAEEYIVASATAVAEFVGKEFTSFKDLVAKELTDTAKYVHDSIDAVVEFVTVKVKSFTEWAHTQYDTMVASVNNAMTLAIKAVATIVGRAKQWVTDKYKSVAELIRCSLDTAKTEADKWVGNVTNTFSKSSPFAIVPNDNVAPDDPTAAAALAARVSTDESVHKFWNNMYSTIREWLWKALKFVEGETEPVVSGGGGGRYPGGYVSDGQGGYNLSTRNAGIGPSGLGPGGSGRGAGAGRYNRPVLHPAGPKGPRLSTQQQTALSALGNGPVAADSDAAAALNSMSTDQLAKAGIQKNGNQYSFAKGADSVTADEATDSLKGKIKGGSFSAQAPRVMQRLMKDFGLTKEQAAGVVGNLGHESVGLQAGIQEKNPISGRGGLGWAQWTGPRRRAFENYLAQTGQKATDPEANYGFLKAELSGQIPGEDYSKSIQAVKQTNNARDATAVFEQSYEGAGTVAMGSRDKYTDQAIAAYGQNGPPTPAADGTYTQAQIDAERSRIANERDAQTARAAMLSGASSSPGNSSPVPTARSTTPGVGAASQEDLVGQALVYSKQGPQSVRTEAIDPTYGDNNYRGESLKGACVRGVAGIATALTGDKQFIDLQKGGNGGDISNSGFLQNTGKYDSPSGLPKNYLNDPSQWRVGDIVTAQGGSHGGHISIYTAQGWMSDGKQGNMVSIPGYTGHQLNRLNAQGLASINPDYVKGLDPNSATAQAMAQLPTRTPASPASLQNTSSVTPPPPAATSAATAAPSKYTPLILDNSQAPSPYGKAAEAAAQVREGLDVSDPKDRAVMEKWLKDGGHPINTQTLAWCSSGVAASMVRAGIQPPQNAQYAPSWGNWGHSVDVDGQHAPPKGSVVTVYSNKDDNKNTVAPFIEHTAIATGRMVYVPGEGLKIEVQSFNAADPTGTPANTAPGRTQFGSKQTELLNFKQVTKDSPLGDGSTVVRVPDNAPASAATGANAMPMPVSPHAPGVNVSALPAATSAPVADATPPPASTAPPPPAEQSAPTPPKDAPTQTASDNYTNVDDHGFHKRNPFHKAVAATATLMIVTPRDNYA